MAPNAIEERLREIEEKHNDNCGCLPFINEERNWLIAQVRALRVVEEKDATNSTAQRAQEEK